MTLFQSCSSRFSSVSPDAHVIMQIQSNALAALEAIDQEMAQSIMEEGCVTGDRINGLCDGVTGDWCALWERSLGELQLTAQQSQLLYEQQHAVKHPKLHSFVLPEPATEQVCVLVAACVLH